AGANQTVSGTAVDIAGNTATATRGPVNVDLAPPTISGSIVGGTSVNGWYHADVVVHWTCADSLSGLAAGACPSNTVVTGEGSALSATASVRDRAGNVASASVTGIRIDRTRPVIVVTTTSNGTWNRQAVTVHFTCADALSGIATCPGDTVLSSQGAGQIVTGTASDRAGNTATARSPSISIDLTAPTVRVTGVTSGATYTLGAPAPGCQSSDTLSGLAAPAVLSVSGATPNGVGTLTATCAGAVDRAGNMGSASVQYFVRYAFTGFFSPVANPPSNNAVQAHSVVPVRFSLADSRNRSVTASSAIRSITVQAVTAFAQADPTQATPAEAVRGTSLGFRSEGHQYIFWWVTPSQQGKYVLFVTLDDGTVHPAYFTLSGVHRLDDDFRSHCSLDED
ncbi:MAG TPA: PxKF domain-containing protein, partial [Ilumatobacteraceae bacterium]